jgi:hypothetical protein
MAEDQILKNMQQVTGNFVEWRHNPTEQLGKLHALLGALLEAQPATSLPSPSSFDEFKAWITNGGYSAEKNIDVRNMGPSEGNGLVADELIRYEYSQA